MTTLLHIDAAAHRSTESVTRCLGAQYARRWRTAHRDGRYVHRDLARDPAAPIDSAYCALGRRLERTAGYDGRNIDRFVADTDELATWHRTAPLIDELLAADVVLIATPMYNFGLPAALKAWIDRVTFPGVLNPPDRTNPLQSKQFILLAATGGRYGPGSPREPLNFLLPHLSGWLTAYGARAERIEQLTVEGTMAAVLGQSADRQAAAGWSRETAERRLAELAGWDKV